MPKSECDFESRPDLGSYSVKTRPDLSLLPTLCEELIG